VAHRVFPMNHPAEYSAWCDARKRTGHEPCSFSNCVCWCHCPDRDWQEFEARRAGFEEKPDNGAPER
jgi:hypothetical protein